ncbi:Na-translocating system protein MpsC family protein [Paenibacillus sp. Z6-24]
MKRMSTDHPVAVYMTKRINEYYESQCPEVGIWLDERCIILHLKDFIGSRMENIVRQKEDPDVFRTLRELMMEYTLQNFTRDMKEQFGIRIKDMYYDWEERDFSGMIVGLLEGDAFAETAESFPHQYEVNERTSEITNGVQRVPDRIYSFWMDERLLVIVRDGLLIPLEQELLRQGAKELLRKTKRVLERNEFLYHSRIPEILGLEVEALYLDWQFDHDRSVLIYQFK